MRIMIDTNVIISAALFPNGRAAKAFYKAMLPPYEPMICDYIVEELRKKFIEKFPDKQSEMEEFLHNALNFIELVNTPDKAEESEELIRDPKDRPILRAALNEHAELFLTGDKDFLESSVSDPRIVSVATFLDM
jgi:putative PIN family toxin of toxin-antitoxin system